MSPKADPIQKPSAPDAPAPQEAELESLLDRPFEGDAPTDREDSSKNP